MPLGQLILMLLGIICLVGALILIDSPFTGFGVSLGLALGITLPLAAITILLMRLVLKSFKWKPSMGNEQLVGRTCEVTETIRPTGSALDGSSGMVFLEGELFNAGQRPAINVGISVSRVGGDAQTKAMRKVAGRLRLDLASYRELAAFAQFGSDLDRATRAQLERGQRLTEILKQPQYSPVPLDEQVIAIFAVTNGFADDVPVNKVRDFEVGLLQFMRTAHPEIGAAIMTTKDLAPELVDQLKAAIEEYKQSARFA